MSGKPSALNIYVRDILTKIIVDRQFSVGIKASSMGGLEAYPSTRHCSSCPNPMAKKWGKHHDDLANVKQILSFFPDYIPPLASTVNRDSIPHDFEYTLITTYIPKEIRVVGPQLGQILALKNNDFNLGDRKNYAMLALHRYLMKMTGKKSHIVSQS